MARKPRLHYEGANYHVYSRGNRRQTIFRDDADRRLFLTLLMDLESRLELQCHAWCLMTNHFHLLIEVGRHSASRIMQSLLSRYAQLFNLKYETTGHLFQGRPGMLLCRQDAYFLELLRYVHLNPVEAEIVPAPDQWAWSSHRSLAWGVSDPLVDRAKILAMFDPDLETAARLYRDFVAAGKPGEVNGLPFDPMLPHPEPVAAPSPVRDINVIAEMTVSNEDITLGQLRGRSRARPLTRLRTEFIVTAWKSGYGAAEIARYLGCSDANIAQILRRNA